EGLEPRKIAEHVSRSAVVARRDAYLAVWGTFPKLRDWMINSIYLPGWTYITAVVWGKSNGLGPGWHVRGDAELALLYRKGHPKPRTTLSSLVLAERTGHSEKPQKALRALVEWAVPAGGLVVDLYAGASASLAIACRSL